MGNYAELHCHSAFSFLDGVSLPEELVEKATKLELSGIALTDHNGFYGIPRFAKAAKQTGMPTIFGTELTIQTDNFKEAHLILLAKNPAGYKTLSSIITKAQLNGTKGSPYISLNDLTSFNLSNLLVLSGCRKGPITQALYTQGNQAAHKELHKLLSIFPKDNFIIEIWNHNDPIDSARNDFLTTLAIQHKLSFVATQNVHYATPEKHQLANLVAAIKANKTLVEMNPYLNISGSQFLIGYKNQLKRFSRWPSAVDTTAELAKDISFEFSMLNPGLPKFLVPAGYNEDSWLTKLVNQYAPFYYGSRDNETIKGAWKQLDHELEIIKRLGFSGYFLTVFDIVQFCKKSNILCQGRGSAANSAVCYVLGITKVDAVSMGLLFERFLSEAREEPPDIDLDIESTRREEVIQYIYTKYGRTNAAQVANVIEYKWPLAIRDVAKALGYSQQEISQWSSLIKINKYYQNNKDLNQTTIPSQVLQYASELLGLPRHLGLHTGGMVITKTPVSEICPVEWARHPNRSVLQWDKYGCEFTKLVKFDLLGLKMLETIKKATEIINSYAFTKINLSKIPQQQEVYEMLSKADSIGVFQVESRAQMNTLPRLKPKCFYDLVIEVALIRPGPIQSKSVHPYLKRRLGEEPVTYLHPCLKPVLEKTLGIPIFQEQLMKIVIELAGFTPTEADELRQALTSKYASSQISIIKEKLFYKLKERNIDTKTAEEVYGYLQAFSKFGFPESHSISFAYITYISAWLKYNYPAAYLVALLNSQPVGFWAPSTLIQDAQRHGIIITSPDVNSSMAEAHLKINDEGTVDFKKGPVILGLTSIKNISLQIAKRIQDNAPYLSIEDLIEKTQINKLELQSLAAAGALASLGYKSRKEAIWQTGLFLKNLSPFRLPNFFGKNGLLKTREPNLPEETLEDLIYLDSQTTEIWINNNPLSLYSEILSKFDITKAKDLITCENNQKVEVAGIITHRQRPATAKGTMFLNLEDETGLMNIIFSPGAVKRFAYVISTSNVLVIKGTLQKYQGSIAILAHKAIKLPPLIRTPSRDFC